MCNCREELAKQLNEYYKAKGQIIDFDLISGKTHSRYEYTPEGRKTSKTAYVLHSYCPFCGRKYD